VNVRVGTEADVGFAAALHTSEITEGFLPTLGRAFLARLYRRRVRSQHSFLLIADDDGVPVGFVAGSEDVRALYRAFLVRDGVPAAARALPRVIRSVGRVVETLRYPAGGDADLPAAELLAIAVAPGGRGRGVGRALVDALTSELARRGVAAVRVVVGADNAGALRLYEACGFKPATRIEVHRGTASRVLTWP
jgi:ribosomal protein S18 acetylase RimI-like enzyme